ALQQSPQMAQGAEKTATPAEPQKRLTRAEIVATIAAGGGSLSMSQTAWDVYQLTLDSDAEADAIAEAIEREPSLTSEILRLGNSSHYNSSGKEISDLEQIVLRIGRRRIGELAIADNVCATLGDRLLP